MSDKVFTDEDLKRYKELTDKGHEIPAHMAVALLSRLEAAEAIVNCMDDWHLEEWCTNACSFDKAREAWRKSRGLA